ncbi:MAG: hypothetical protein KIT87_01025 [Anaerolineae bacterium]|nr:hypothetical protein [Anaerolineae bacterium]
MTTEYPIRSTEIEASRETPPAAPPRPPVDLVRVLSAVVLFIVAYNLGWAVSSLVAPAWAALIGAFGAVSVGLLVGGARWPTLRVPPRAAPAPSSAVTPSVAAAPITTAAATAPLVTTPSVMAPAAPPTARGPRIGSPTLPSLPAVTLPRLGAGVRLEWLGLVLFAACLGVYAYTRLVQLDAFPIYFFTDEAIHPVLGSELVQRGWTDAFGRLFPPYFQNGQYWNLSLSVYLHGITATLFGKSIVVTRATSALVSLTGAFAIGLILKLIFKNRLWWASVLVLTIMPAWFMHSRTAFEVVLMVSFYSWFLLFYLLYRYRSPLFLFPALLFGAATFYSYSNGQSVMGITGILLAVSDLRYHLRHWRVILFGLAVLLLFEWPYIRFRNLYPDAVSNQLRILDSYLFHAITPQEKVTNFITRYLRGLSPGFWFFPTDTELIRHRWLGMGNMHLATLPFWLVGVAVALWRVKSSAYRTMIFALLAAPAGAALADIGVLRVLAFIVPSAVLVTVGLDWLLSLPRNRVVYAVGGAVVLVFGVVTSYSMLNDALVRGPTWYQNYGLYGMQWGTKQIYGYLPEYLKQHPNARVYLSPSWANGTEIFNRFFLPNESRVQLMNVDAFITDKRSFDPNTIFVMTPDEVDRANLSKKFQPIQVEQAMPYPNGANGFIFARLSYVPNVDAIFQAEKEARTRPITSQVVIQGETVTLNHSVLDSGEAKHMVDGDRFTLARVREANPAIVEFVYPTPRPITELAADLGSMDFSLTVSLYATPTSQPVTYTESYRGLPPDPHVEMKFPNAPPQVTKVRIEVKDLNAGELAKIHIRELTPK